MVKEKIDYDFLHEKSLKEYIKTLKQLSSENFAPIQCDQGSGKNYKIVHACDYAANLVKAELDEMMEEKKKKYDELDAKYGKNNYFVNLAGEVLV